MANNQPNNEQWKANARYAVASHTARKGAPQIKRDFRGRSAGLLQVRGWARQFWR